jgi:hypothetical protein
MLQQMQTLAQKQVHCSSFVCYLSSDWPSSIPGTFHPNSFPFEFIFGLCAVLFSLPHFLSTFLQQTFGFLVDLLSMKLIPTVPSSPTFSPDQFTRPKFQNIQRWQMGSLISSKNRTIA